MLKIFGLKLSQIICPLVTTGVLAMSVRVEAHPIILGPANPGAESKADHWHHDTSGSAALFIGLDDPAVGTRCFIISNSVPGQENRADWQSEKFSLQGAGKNQRPITLSFLYKVPDKVKPGDVVFLSLRFFDLAKVKFLGQQTVALGATADQSEMAQYQTMTLTNILAPKESATADIYITVNVNPTGPWTSGSAQFDDILATTTTAPPWAAIAIGVLAALLTAALGWLLFTRRRRKPPLAA